jgi:complement component 1 Q subcomponent-binding protein, mitochondrial
MYNNLNSNLYLAILVFFCLHRDLEEEVKEPVRVYLANRGVDDDMASFLHDYMMNKDKIELIRWLKNIELYVKK